jgi:hypothetical protein
MYGAKKKGLAEYPFISGAGVSRSTAPAWLAVLAVVTLLIWV